MYTPPNEITYRPMDTAPKTGKVIALQVKDGFGVFTMPKCCWHNNAWRTALRKVRIKPTPIGWKDIRT